jgi:hypothetical protein
MSDTEEIGLPRCNVWKSGIQCRFSPRHGGPHEFIDENYELRADRDRLRAELERYKAATAVRSYRALLQLNREQMIHEVLRLRGEELDEVERLRHAVSAIGLGREDMERRALLAEQQLSAVTAARDEACDLAEIDTGKSETEWRRIAELRKVGR